MKPLSRRIPAFLAIVVGLTVVMTALYLAGTAAVEVWLVLLAAVVVGGGIASLILFKRTSARLALLLLPTLGGCIALAFALEQPPVWLLGPVAATALMGAIARRQGWPLRVTVGAMAATLLAATLVAIAATALFVAYTCGQHNTYCLD